VGKRTLSQDEQRVSTGELSASPYGERDIREDLIALKARSSLNQQWRGRGRGRGPGTKQRAMKIGQRFRGKKVVGMQKVKYRG